jgi:hypothetical protein
MRDNRERLLDMVEAISPVSDDGRRFGRFQSEMMSTEESFPWARTNSASFFSAREPDFWCLPVA